MSEEKKRTPAQEKFWVECMKFLDQVMDPSQNDQDVAKFICLVGLERLSGQSNDASVAESIQEVYTNKQNIAKIVAWMSAYVQQEIKAKAEADALKIKAESQPAKKDKVPAIYATTKESKPQEPEKRKETSNKVQKPKKDEKQQKPKQPKPRILDRFEDKEPPTRKRLKQDQPHNDAQMKPEQGEQKGQPQQEQKVKCKYFPFCKKEDTCPYFHPTEKCPYFPKCKFKSNCIYAHEPCKFEDRCTRANCFYDHPFRKFTPQMEIMKLFATLAQPKRPARRRAPSNDTPKEQPAPEQPKQQ